VTYELSDYLDSKNLKLYLEEISKIPPITEEEEKSWPGG
jgi:hypothetical protein